MLNSHYNINNSDNNISTTYLKGSQKTKDMAIFLCCCFGLLGAHSFYVNKKLIGCLQLALTLSIQGISLSFIWAFIDLIMICLNKYYTKDGEALLKNRNYVKINSEIQSYITKFISQHIIEDKYPVGLNIEDEYIKALQFLIKKDLNDDISFNLLKEKINEDKEQLELQIFKEKFLQENSNLINNTNLTDWLNAYLNTFGQNFDYIYYFKMLLNINNITLYDKNATYDEINETYIEVTNATNRNYKNIESLIENFNSKYNDKLAYDKIRDIMHKRHAIWNWIYFYWQMNKFIESEKLKNLAKKMKENMENNRKINNKNNISINDVDNMEGIEFEALIEKIYSKKGYKTQLTKITGDQGADLIIEDLNDKTAIQIKRYNDNVSNSAIQEVVAAKAYYKCNKAMVITNSYFTKGAVELANLNNVKLIDRDMLEKLIEDYNIVG